MTDPAQILQARLRADLRAAMRNRQPKAVSVLRSLIAAVDNAQAVSVGNAHDRYTRAEFGDTSVEVPRRQLGDDDLRTLLLGEIASREAASIDYDRAGQRDRAEALLHEAELIGRYLGSTGAP